MDSKQFNRVRSNGEAAERRRTAWKDERIADLSDALEALLSVAWDGDPRRQADCDLCCNAKRALTGAKRDVPDR